MSVARHDANILEDRLLTIDGDKLIAERPTSGMIEYLMWHPSLLKLCYIHSGRLDRQMPPDEFIRRYGNPQMFRGMTQTRLIAWHANDRKVTGIAKS